jgi:hypothetical protein
MTEPPPAPASADASVPAHADAPAAAAAAVRSERVAALKASGLLVGAMAVLGALLGIVWEAWSPPGPAGGVLAHGIQAVESEAFIAGDGRFALITVIVGISAALVAWYARPFRAVRGPLIAVALAVGGVAGAALTEWVGYLLRGPGTKFACAAETGKCIDHLPLTVHMHALLLVEAIVALLVYSLFAAFAVSDDLGREGRAGSAAPEPPAVPADGPADGAVPPQPGPSLPGPSLSGPSLPGPSLSGPSLPGPSLSGAEHDPQQRWGHGDGAGPP